MAQQISAKATLEQAGRQAGQMARSAVQSPWVEWLARFGYAARGVVYAFVGYLALQAAFGSGGRTTGAQGAIQEMARQSQVLLGFVAFGLFGYALWRFVQAVLDPENKGDDPKGLVQRGSMLASGIVYGSLAIAAVKMISGSGAAGGDGTQGATASVLDKPFGAVLVGIAGLAVIVGGLFQIKSGWTKKFRDKLKLQEMSPGEQTSMTHAGQFGLISRGVVFLLTGFFLIQAALQSDPSEARGLGGALQTLASQPYGPWLLAVAALGLIAFGVYSVLVARYRRIVF
ncbi:MAG TPA: DUF1206 domain-containing protein [Thermoanaerobaculia bacterium]|nr:DUF1206 domain-containing protein [Thermoanaerobaculia bacterium]